jgi:glycosyltransferase involved in cell wall biosynthesis
MPEGTTSFGPVRLLSAAPPVFLSGIPRNKDLGIAGAFARHYGNINAGFVIFPTWSIEHSGRLEAIRRKFFDHAERYPNHSFRFICNTRTEAALLEQVGLPALFLNKNFMVSDQIFRPLPGAGIEFDAVYTARFMPVKRHELTAAVPRVAYVAYLDPTPGRWELFRTLCAEVLARNPDHVLLNEIVDGLPIRMSHQQVNAALGRAAVGIILSEVEGSSYASMEYMLAGLPVVSTPSKGGRDVFFDPEYCIVCEPDPEAVRDAVAALRARNIPGELIRARTLARIEPERQRFLTLIDDLIEQLGGQRRYGAGAWPFGDISGVTWLPFQEHLAAFAKRLRADLGEELGLGAGALANVQLEARELRPIVAAIRERPGCALLVFGCGNDSHFWERVNRGGTTAFLEDNPQWIADARSSLVTAVVHTVQYGTRVSEWRQLLDQPSGLIMDLPAEIVSRRWDVILVDGPAGYSDTQPGRMKSIHAASRLVAPRGCVFVHDCERPAEQAFAERYLGDNRLFVEVKGRAVLRGYAF